MITDRDAAFHAPPDPAPSTWTETNFFGFSVPERNICAGVYVLFRPVVGVCLAEFSVFDRISFDRRDALYMDSRQHLPVPADLTHYSLENGLTVRATSAPRDYEITYKGTDGTELELTFTALMDPYDINDPAVDPRAASEAATCPEGVGPVEHYRGHFDMTGRLSGTLRLRGEEIPIDCVDTMDHSWGVRPENGQSMIIWGHAHFGEDAVHATFTFDPLAPPADQYRLHRGYLLRDGQVHGLVESELRAHRVGPLGVTQEWTGRDSAGRAFAMQGGAVSSLPETWYSFADIYYTLYRWSDRNGRVGHGSMMEGYNLDQLCGPR